MASSAGKRRRVAPARLSEELTEERDVKAHRISDKEEEEGAEPAVQKKRRGRPPKKAAEAPKKKARSDEEAADGEAKREAMDRKKAEGGAEGRKEEAAEENEGERAEEARTEAVKEEGKTEEKPSRFLEKGLIYFFYRPKVGVEEVHDLDDVQKLYMLLIPKETMKKEDLTHRRHRMLVLTKKRLPDVHSHARYWGFVEETSEEIKDVKADLKAVTYTTKTRGERRLEAARPAGRGFYGILTHGSHTHLAYVLELPEEIGEVQEAFNIAKEGSYIVTAKNPTIPGPMGLAPKEKEELPEELMRLFHGRKFVPLDPPSFLDHKGTEIIIIGASDDLKAELGKTGEQLEKLEEADAALGLTDETVFKELHLEKMKSLAEPLMEGEWM